MYYITYQQLTDLISSHGNIVNIYKNGILETNYNFSEERGIILEMFQKFLNKPRKSTNLTLLAYF